MKRQFLLHAPYAESSLRRSCRTLFNNKSIIGFSIKSNIAQLEILNIILNKLNIHLQSTDNEIRGNVKSSITMFSNLKIHCNSN
jgi:hypothetical protein